MSKKLTQEEFIKRANKVHNNKYDYSESIYTNSSSKIIIICKKHGKFEQIANTHLQGHGCEKCGCSFRGLKCRSSTEEFIEKAKLVHSEKYDYSKVEYIKNNIKVKIICPIHGEFEQSPANHLLGMNCFKCAQKLNSDLKRISLEEFIMRANKIYSNKYDYSLVSFSKLSEKVIIICPIHGKFTQSANSHLAGHECQKCSMISKYEDYTYIYTYDSKDTFIPKAKQVHNNKYDYSLVDYKNCHTPVKIICPIHGIFEQTPFNHMKSKGCSLCSYIETGYNRRKNKKYFLEKAKEIHGDKYDYSQVNFSTLSDKVKIVCKVHGIFLKKASAHLQGEGCPICGVEQSHINIRLNKEEVIKRFKNIHHDLYDYSKVEYTGMHIPVIIVCKEHGEFLMQPNNHIHFQGCPKCSSSNLEKQTEYYLKNNNINYKSQKRFPNCRSKNTLPFDFYLPDFNICIECDGNQHNSLEEFSDFMRNRHLTDSEILKLYTEMKNRDLIKTNYCISNNIQLLRIPYSQLKYIEEYLDNNVLPLLNRVA